MPDQRCTWVVRASYVITAAWVKLDMITKIINNLCLTGSKAASIEQIAEAGA
jgi:hypothetical protein